VEPTGALLRLDGPGKYRTVDHPSLTTRQRAMRALWVGGESEK
jgi:hypothetical protein